MWFVALPEDGFVANVNVLTQAIPEIDVEEYLDLSVAQAPGMMPDFELLRLDVIERSGNELGVMEYTGTQNYRPLHFLATVTVADRTAAIATFTAPPEPFDELRCGVERFLFTLRST